MQVNKGFFHLQRLFASDSFGGDLQKRRTLRVLGGGSPAKPGNQEETFKIREKKNNKI
jgi:hypothetical protein